MLQQTKLCVEYFFNFCQLIFLIQFLYLFKELVVNDITKRSEFFACLSRYTHIGNSIEAVICLPQISFIWNYQIRLTLLLHIFNNFTSTIFAKHSNEKVVLFRDISKSLKVFFNRGFTQWATRIWPSYGEVVSMLKSETYCTWFLEFSKF